MCASVVGIHAYGVLFLLKEVAAECLQCLWVLSRWYLNSMLCRCLLRFLHCSSGFPLSVTFSWLVHYTLIVFSCSNTRVVFLLSVLSMPAQVKSYFSLAVTEMLMLHVSVSLLSWPLLQLPCSLSGIVANQGLSVVPL